MSQEPSAILSLHRRLYNWVLSFAYSPHATLSLFFISVIESSVFPIAPDILLIALGLERPSLVWFYALITTIGSVLGGLLGYFIGAELWQFFSPFFFKYIFSEATFAQVEKLYNHWDFLAIFIGAFTPIPYKVFTISAGVFNISLWMFTLASVIGRGLRFFMVAALLNWYGPRIKIFIDRYFNLLTIAFVVILLGGFFLFNVCCKIAQ